MTDLLKHPGIFTISLDFELHWGNFDKWLAEDYEQYFLTTRSKIIPITLKLFRDYAVHCTWATVGTLMHTSKRELYSNLPTVWPNYHHPPYGMMHYLDTVGVGDDEKDDPFHFAPSLVDMITKTQGQELSTHTFAHYYCNEPGQTLEAFRADIKSAVRVQKHNFNSLPKSIVFPRNQYSEDHIRICAEEGIRAIRSTPDVWWWKVTTRGEETKILRLMRGADAYLKLGGQFSYPLSKVENIAGAWALPASRLLRVYEPRFSMLELRRIDRIKNEMRYAARHNEVYHLWWHPHNFGFHPAENLHALREICRYFKKLSEQYGMISLTMQETAELLDNHHTRSAQ